MAGPYRGRGSTQHHAWNSVLKVQPRRPSQNPQRAEFKPDVIYALPTPELRVAYAI